MDKICEYDLIDFPPPPWWVRMTPGFSAQWRNPVFQKSYVRVRRFGTAEFSKALKTGAVLSSVIFLPLTLVRLMWTNDSLDWLLAAIYILLGLVVLFMAFVGAIRMLAMSLVQTSVTVSRDVAGEQGQAILTLPVSDLEIFEGLCFGPVIRSAVAIQGLLGWLIGISSAPILGAVMLTFRTIYEERLFSWAGIISSGILVLIVLMMWSFRFFQLVALASGRFSLRMPPAAAIALSLLYVLGLCLGVSIVAFIPGIFIFMRAVSTPSTTVIVSPVGIVIAIAVSMVALDPIIKSAGILGASTLARVRRPGYYVMEEADAVLLQATFED
jgi:hypothetical protein